MASSIEVDLNTARLLNTGQGVQALCLVAAEEVYEVMIENISDTTGSGRVYKRNFGLGYHIASAPGESPVIDTGNLKNNIKVEYGKADDKADIVVTSEYALDLEFGTSKMRSRPFMRKSIQEAFATRLDKIINKFINHINENPIEAKHMLEEYYNRYIRFRRSRSTQSKENWRRRRGL